MPRVFSYGSLQQPQVQVATFGRVLEGSLDHLAGFERINLQRGDKQLASLVRSGSPQSQIHGMVFEISEAELAIADAYEATDAYSRIPVVLGSDMQAWVYIDAAGSPGAR